MNTTIKAKNRILSLALAVALLLTMTLVLPGPLAVSAAVGIQEDTPTFALKSDTVAFAGYEWYVIGDGTNGTAVKSGHITLLAKDSFGTTAFRTQDNGKANESGWTQYGSNWYEGTFNWPSDYNDSTLMRTMNTAAGHIDAKEAALIAPRFLTSSDGIGGDDTTGQLLWPLSSSEYSGIPGDTFSGDFWLRSRDNVTLANVGEPFGDFISSVVWDSSIAIRPALHLNLSSVLFTSDAAGGKDLVNTPGVLEEAVKPGNKIKLTVEDSGLGVTISNVAVTGNTVNFNYIVTSGSPNRLSAIVRNRSGAVTHYGNLDTNTMPATVTLPASLSAAGGTLEVFIEQVNGPYETDFASTPQVILTLPGGGGQGAGPVLDADPARLAFGAVPVGESAAERVAVSGRRLTGGIACTLEGEGFILKESGWDEETGGVLEVTFTPTEEEAYSGTLLLTSPGAADLIVPLTGAGGTAEEPEPPPAPSPAPSSGRTRLGRSSGVSFTPPPPDKTRLPASAFTWDSRTLTIDHDSITPLGLLSVQWDDVPLTRGTDYGVYQGSVAVRFGAEFMAAQSPGDHAVRVEFLNHTGETTVTVGDTPRSPGQTAANTADLPDNATHNPSTGGYPDGGMNPAHNPNTGDGRGIWPVLLLGCLGGAAIAIHTRASKTR